MLSPFKIVEGHERDRSLLQDNEQHRQRIRLFVAARSRFAEDCLASGISHRRVHQVVILGAGLDTLAYRGSLGEKVVVFEVDHPATQNWKRRVLGSADIGIPSQLTFVAVDFESDDLLQKLLEAGLDPTVATFVIMLGVVVYLTRQAFSRTLSQFEEHRRCEIVFDYSEAPADLDPSARAVHDDLAARTAAAGEPHIGYFSPIEIREILVESRFETIEDLDVYDLLARYLGQQVMVNRSNSSRARGGAHVLHGRSRHCA